MKRAIVVALGGCMAALLAVAVLLLWRALL